MKATLLICSYNRPAYLRRCLASVKRAGITDVMIIDDCSTDKETLQLIAPHNHIRKALRKGICDSLLDGIELCFAAGADLVINLDSDAIIRNDFLERLLELHAAFPKDIITGFHSTTRNKDGSERHRVLEEDLLFEGGGVRKYYRKQSVGGINMLWTRETWQRMKPVIENAQAKHLNWDHQVSLASNGIICAVPSLVQHIGIESSMNHTEQPDVADDFKMLSLPNVTLVCVDDDKERCKKAIEGSKRDIVFGAELFLYDENIKSKEGYSKFIIKNLDCYVHTPYALIVQHDGYVKNPEAWTDEFLQYDYIGATWWYKDGKNVGNGGFSLRSKKLLELCATLPTTKTHPEDHVICREMRGYLESKGVKFAPDSLANQFSFEGYNQIGTWSGQFGFHGSRAFRPSIDPRKTGFIINQFLGLGDILYIVPLARHWMNLGHDVIWPVADEYFDIKRHFPDIQFVRKSEWPKVRYDHPGENFHQWQYGLYQVKPLRWNMTKNLSEAMTSKYCMYGLDPEMWRQLKWERDIVKEMSLASLIGAVGEYELVCQEFGNVTDGGADVRLLHIGSAHMQRIYLGKMQGFTLLDWSTVIENATIIHAVSSSTLYLFETLNLKAKEVHLYSRKAGANDFLMVKSIMNKYYILHI